MSGFSRTNWIAFAIAALWAVHPLGTEAVTNIVGRADLFAATAVLGGLLLHVRARESGGSRRFAWLVALAAVTLFGVFSKESAVALVAVVALYEMTWWNWSKTSTRASPERQRGGDDLAGRFAHRAPPALAWIAAAVLLPVVFMWYERSSVLNAAPAAELPYVDNPIVGAGFWQARLTAVAVMARYLALVVWPARLSADYSYAQIPLATGTAGDWVAWVVVAALAAAVATLFRRHRAAFFFGAFALVTFLPASNLIVPSGTIMAERLMYLPMIGILALIVLAVEGIASRVLRGRPAGAEAIGRVERAGPRRWLAGAAAVVIVALTARTIARNRDWRDDRTLWSATVRAAPASFKGHRALAEALYEPGAPDATADGLDRAIAEFEQAVAVLRPLPDALSDARTYRQLGAYHLERGDRLGRDAIEHDAPLPAESAAAYRDSIAALTRCAAIITAAAPPHASQSGAADVNRLLSAAYVRVKDTQNAIGAALRARALEPSSLPGHQQLTAALLTAERYDDAAIALMVGTLITNRAELRQQLMALYQQGVDPLRCAVAPAPPNAPAGSAGGLLDPACPTVRRHLCAASKDAIELQTNAGTSDDAERLKTAASDLGCR